MNLEAKKNSLFLMSDKVLKMLGGFIIGALIARYLGTYNYGEYSYLLVFTSIFWVIADLGVDSILHKEISKNEKSVNIIFSSVIFLKIFVGIIVILVMNIISFYVNVDVGNFSKYLLIYSVVFLIKPFETIKIYFQYLQASKYEVISSQVAYILGIICRILILILKLDYVYLVYLLVFESFVFSSFLIYFYRYKYSKKIRVKFVSIEYIKYLLKESYHFILANLMIILYMRIDQLMIKKMLPLDELAIYSVGVKFAEVWYFIPISITVSYASILINTYSKSKKEYEKQIVSCGIKLFLISVVFVMGICIFSPLFIKLLYGEEYVRASMIMSIYSFTGIYVSFGLLFNNHIIAKGHNYLKTRLSILGFLLNLLLNVVLIRHIGIVGSALATFASEFVVGYVYYFFDKRNKEIFHLQNIIIIESFRSIKNKIYEVLQREINDK